jgi:GT2 family glycosyltransferase
MNNIPNFETTPNPENDDCYPFQDSIPKLLDFCQTHPQTIVGGQCIDPDTLEPSYGGIIVQRWGIKHIHARDNETQECDGLAGNFVCLNRSVIDDCDYPNSRIYPHYCGDIAYTNQLQKKAKYTLLVYKSSKALCKNNQIKESWLLPESSLLDYWKQYFKIESPFYWKALLNSHIQILGFRGLLVYFYQRLIKFWIFVIIVKVLPINIRTKLKKG